jgi:hypothetical protein
MKKSVTLNGVTNPEEVLQLPKGRLLVGKLGATFAPETVVEAAAAIVGKHEHDYSESTYYSQAEVIEFAANQCRWNRNPDYRTF